jgi:hypothetical protein
MTVTPAQAKAALATLTAYVGQATPVPTPTPTPAPVAQSTFFNPASFWYQDVSKAPLAGNSAALVADAVRQTRQYYGGPSRTNVTINTTSYTPPVYRTASHYTKVSGIPERVLRNPHPRTKVHIAHATTPLVNVGFNDCQNKGYFDAGLKDQFTGVPIPPGAAPAAGSDSEMVVYSSTMDTLWEFWEMTKDSAGNWSACWGGRIQNASKSTGIFSGGYGATATGLSFLGGLVTLAEYQAGAINHCLGIAFVENAAGQCFPAQRNDGGYGSSPIMEGQRFRFDPTINMDSLGLGKLATMVAKAGQKYGFVAWDKAGAVTLRAENSTTWEKTDPNAWDLSGLPWAKLQALPAGYGQ